MTSPRVHWHEGMFLRPQHLQTAQRSGSRLVMTNSKWDHHYNWGLRLLKLDADALANYRFVVRSLEARLRDGTLVVVSEQDEMPPLPLRAAMEKNSSLTVYLGVPLYFPVGRPNASFPEMPGATRYLIETEELEDENTGQNPQPIQVRRLNLRLLLSTDDLTGYEVLPLAKLEKSARAEATPQLDESFIPPLLACDAWRPLQTGLLQSLYERISKKMELLADQVVTRGITFDSLSQGDTATFNQLRELNQAFTILRVLVFAKGVHPLATYGELCRLMGQLAIFGAEHRPPELPVYDHDDLARCFFPMRKFIDSFLDVMVEPEYQERDFLGTGLRMQVSLESPWLESSWQLFLAVRTTLNIDECVRLLTKAGQLDMKIGSSDRVDAIYRQGDAGLRFNHIVHPPRALPASPGRAYFQILGEAKDPEWQQVKRSLTLAIRLNEKLVTGNIEGQRFLTIKHGGQTVPLQFTLYVIAKE